MRAELEPKQRHIDRSVTPHRMGGPRDVLQGWADPDDDDLVFQIGSDTRWDGCGGVGAVFVYLKPLYLKARWFRRGYAWVDGH